MRIKSLSLFFILSTLLYSNTLTLETIINDNNKSSIQKDYDLFLYLKNDSISSLDSLNALSYVSNTNKYIFEEFAKKSNHDETLAAYLCMNANINELISTNSDCIAAGINLKKALSLNSLQINEVIEKLSEGYPKLTKKLKILNSPIPFTKIVSSSKDNIYDILLNTSSKFKIEKLNYKLPKSTLKKLMQDERFEILLKTAISNSKLNYLQSTFFEIDDKDFSYEISFLLGLNRFLNNKIDKKTLEYFFNAQNKAQNQDEKDKINFWLHKITNENKYKEILLQSTNLNIYTVDVKIKSQDLNLKPLNLNNDFEKNCLIENKILINSYAKTLTNFNNNYINEEFRLGTTHLNLDLLLKIYDKKSIKYEKLFDQETNLKLFIESMSYLKSNFYNNISIFYAYLDGVDFVKDRVDFLNYRISSLNHYLLLELYPKAKHSTLAKEFTINYLLYTKVFTKRDTSFSISFENLYEPL